MSHAVVSGQEVCWDQPAGIPVLVRAQNSKVLIAFRGGRRTKMLVSDTVSLYMCCSREK